MDNAPYQWNAGGWFGSQLGASCWMLIAGLLLLPIDAGVAVATLGIFAAVNVAGTAMWMQRERLAPIPAIQMLIVLVGAAGALATYVMDSAGRFESLGTGPGTSARSMYIILALMVAGLLLMFHLIGRGISRTD